MAEAEKQGAGDVSLGDVVEAVASGRNLSVDEAEATFNEIMEGRASPVQMSAILVGLRTKGIVPSEVAGGVRAMQRAMIAIPAERPEELVDTCGTGGGSVTTFNISTAAALVAAGAGVRIAKHGNRSFTSRSGSADVLEALGVEIELTPEAMSRILAETGIVFMFAPLLHPAMRHVMPVRRELGIRTIMNLLGPLTNPAGARRQVVGVADPGVRELIVRALAELGHERALVVHGEPGMDEISPSGPTRVAALTPSGVSESTLRPEDVGLETHEPGTLAGGSPEDNAEIIRRVLSGRDEGGAEAAVLLNAGAAIQVSGAVDSLREGVEAARESIGSGAAKKTLEALAEASRAE